MGTSVLSGSGTVLLFFGGAVVFIALVMITAFLIRPSRPNREKLSVYECGEEPSGSAWGRFNIRFYVIALIFVLFDVEIVFLFPWATVFARRSLMEATSGQWGWFALGEMFIFIAILSLGLAYAWKKGFLEWEKPQNDGPLLMPAPPDEKYLRINLKYKDYKVREVTRN
jgi:NADH-quinone oxidoreductase subunit A